jgi:hypothetical protein
MGFTIPGSVDDINNVRLNIPSMMQSSNAFPGKGKVIPNIDASHTARNNFQEGILSPKMAKTSRF